MDNNNSTLSEVDPSYMVPNGEDAKVVWEGDKLYITSSTKRLTEPVTVVSIFKKKDEKSNSFKLLVDNKSKTLQYVLGSNEVSFKNVFVCQLYWDNDIVAGGLSKNKFSLHFGDSVRIKYTQTPQTFALCDDSKRFLLNPIHDKMTGCVESVDMVEYQGTTKRQAWIVTIMLSGNGNTRLRVSDSYLIGYKRMVM